MPSLMITGHARETTLNRGWVPATTFNGGNRLVDEQRDEVSSDYQGRPYQIIERREGTFSRLERFGRGFLGTLTTVCTLCPILFSRFTRGLFTTYKTNIRFALLQEQRAPRPIDSFDETKVKMLVDAYISQTISPDQFIPHAGKHMRVFELVDFPGLIFKLPTAASAQEMVENINRCQALVKEHALNHCIIPSAKIIPIAGNKVIFVMEKIEGLSHTAAQESSEEAYESFQEDSEKQAKWKEFFRQAAEFIALSGYWDTAWSNILLMENGFGFVDFENVNVSDDDYHQATGLSRLRDLAPSEFFDMISEIAQKYSINLRPNLFASSELRKKDLERSRAVRKWHREHGITQAEKIDTRTALYHDLNKTEKMIIDKFNEEVEQRATSSYYEGNLILQREVHWQPFREASYQQNRLEFETALQTLNKKGLVCNWTMQENSFQPFLVLYKIYL